jgi:chitinase
MLLGMRRYALWLAIFPALGCKSGSSVPATRDAGDAHAQVDAGRARDASSGLETLLRADLFARLFPHRADSACNAQVFDHAALIAAAARFPAFASEGSEAVRKRELAAFLANISHETTGGWPSAPDGPSAWGLCFREERGCEQGGCTQYCDATRTQYPCADGQTYHGRGPLQLSWNYNYGQVGAALQLDLLHDPGRVTRDGVVGFETALWFWMTPQAPKPSAHDVMTGAWQPSAADTAAGRVPGFGLTVNIINGGLECGIVRDPRVEDRVAFFERYASVLGTDVGDDLRCATMKRF